MIGVCIYRYHSHSQVIGFFREYKFLRVHHVHLEILSGWKCYCTMFKVDNHQAMFELSRSLWPTVGKTCFHDSCIVHLAQHFKACIGGPGRRGGVVSSRASVVFMAIKRPTLLERIVWSTCLEFSWVTMNILHDSWYSWAKTQFSEIVPFKTNQFSEHMKISIQGPVQRVATETWRWN